MLPKPATDRIAIFIVSCDNYSDLWQPFFELYKRFWPDCPYPVYLLSNHKRYELHNIIMIPVGQDISWSDNVLEGLRHIKEEFIVLWIDDLFLLERVHTDAVIKICEEFMKVAGNCIRLNPTVKADTCFNDYFGVASKGTIYRASTVLSLWRKDVLNKLLRPGESAWDFEIYGTVRSDSYDGFFSAWVNCFNVINGVVKGKWQRKSYIKIQSLCADANMNSRDIMTRIESILLWLKVIRSKALSFIPSPYRRKVKDIFLFGKYNYRVSRTGVN